MKTTLFAAMSLDGFIADKDGSEDFLADVHWWEFVKLAEKIGCLIVSRKAYDIVNQWESQYNFDTIKAIKIIVSKNAELELKQGFSLATSPEKAIEISNQNNCSEVLVAGGGSLNGAFLENNFVDELILTVEPCILGQGTYFVGDVKLGKKLKLKDVTKVEDGIVKLNYEIVK